MVTRTRVRRSAALAALATLLALAGCDAGPAPSGTQGDPGPSGGSPGAEAPGPDDVMAAIAALDDLGSYRFVQTTSEGDAAEPSEARGVVVNGDPRRTRIEYATGGVSGGGQVAIGDRLWVSVAGGAYREQEGVAGSGETQPNPIAQQLDPWSLGISELEDLGIERQGGVDARHLRGNATADDPRTEDGFPDGSGFTGVVDVWIALDRGYLVAARAAGTQVWPSPDDAVPAPSSVAYLLDIAIEGVDDPANVVEEPAAAATSAPPAGDPAAAAMIRRIPRAQAKLDGYVYRITSGTAGMELGATLAVVNRPVPAARLETEGVAGFEASTIVIIGRRAWSRAGEGPWLRASGESLTCNAGIDTLGDATGRCTVDRLRDVSASLQGTRATFTVVSAAEMAGGIESTHLRSEAGLGEGELTIPGTTDVWIANDGGYLVKLLFTGTGITSAAEIERVNDPGLVIEAPAE